MKRMIFRFAALSMWIIASIVGDKCENERNNCCSGYLWNTTEERCLECMAGYGGVNCALQCPYPLYGPGCQMICECDRATCDRAYGCIRKSTKMTVSWPNWSTAGMKYGAKRRNETTDETNDGHIKLKPTAKSEEISTINATHEGSQGSGYTIGIMEACIIALGVVAVFLFTAIIASYVKPCQTVIIQLDLIK